MKIVTTDEEIARFVAINLVTAIYDFTKTNMTGEHLIGLKNAVKGDIKDNFKKTSEFYEIAIKDSFRKG